MIWTKLEASEYHIRKTFRDVLPHVPNYIRDNRNTIYVETPESELGWLDKVSKDLNLKATRVATPPDWSTAPCGCKTVNIEYHQRSCPKCKALRGISPKKPATPKARKNGRSTTIFKLPGLPDFSLNGLLSYLKGQRDAALTYAQELDAAVAALEKVEGIDRQIKELASERIEQQKALAFFLARKGDDK